MADNQVEPSVAIATLVERRFLQFLQEFEIPTPHADAQDAVDAPPEKEYVQAVRAMRLHEMNTLFVDFAHLSMYDAALALSIMEEFYQFEPVLRRAIAQLVLAVEPEYLLVEGQVKEFFVAFFNLGTQVKVRDLRMSRVGMLSSFSGTVTRTSEVRPELLSGRFVCGECGQLSPPVEQQFKFTEPVICDTEKCPNRTRWQIDVSQSRFVDWQRVRVQENADEIPAGSMPRSVDVVLRHGAVEKAKAGDRVIFTGYLIVIPDITQLYKAGQVTSVGTKGGGGMGRASAGEGITGMRALGVRDLTYRVAFIAHSVARGTPTTVNVTAMDEEHPDADIVSAFSREQVDEFRAMAASGRVYRDLVSSLVPTIHGHVEIKKGLLLMLLGGVHKRTSEGVRLRGDINVCIVGDPSTAKSQFLKYATRFWPRSVYTSGKSASAAGLTASVAKDPDTGEFTIEAGALMLADNGICCIDEFDKMDIQDQVAIHEAMEQQTISITKAGIQATLNARTSILAAANPVFGRYDTTRTLRQNVNISAPIMSRFDLFFIVLDELDELKDEAIARHIVNVHQKRTAALVDAVYPMDVILNYVRYARTVTPRLTEAAKRAIVRCYLLLRSADSLSSAQSSYRVTVRQLESMVRLSEALARLHLDTDVRERYVLEAYALIKRSMRRIDHSDVELGDDMDEGDGTLALTESEREAIAQAIQEGAPPRTDDVDDEALLAAIRAHEAATGGDVGVQPAADAPATDSSASTNAPIAAAHAGHSAAGGAVGSEDGAGASATAGTAEAAAGAAAGAAPRQRVQVSYAKFAHIKTALAVRLREQEAADAEDAAASIAEAGGVDKRDEHMLALEGAVRQGDLISWYVEENAAASGIAAEADLAAERQLVRKVISKLISERVLLFALPTQAAAAGVSPDERWIKLDYDFVVDGFDSAMMDGQAGAYDQ